MKIAIIANPLIAVPPIKYGGIERIVSMLIENLLEKGHEVTLYANPLSKVNCKLRGYTESAKYSLSDFVKINLLTSEILLKNYDLVHTFGRMNNIATLMPFKIPKIVSYQLPPTVSQVKKAVSLAPKNTLYFTACSSYIGNQIKDYCNVTTIYNGIPIRKFDFSEKVTPDAPLVFLGRIQREKGTWEAIQVAKATGKNLIIAGNVPNEEIHILYFEQKVKPYIDGKQIQYIGAVDDVQKNELLGKAAAFLMPVLWGEPFGIVMTEALACGTPVIAFGQGAIPEVVQNGINGFVCDTIEEMAAAVNNVHSIDRGMCRKIAEEKFSDEILATQYEDLYKNLIHK